jgi:hypothetical protein
MSALIHSSVPEEVKSAIDALASREFLKPSEIIRRAVVKELRAEGFLGETETRDRPAPRHAA